MDFQWFYDRPAITLLTILLATVIFFVLKSFRISFSREQSAEEVIDPNEPRRCTEIIVYTRDGQVVEKFMAFTDSIVMDEENGIYIDFETSAGQPIIFMLGSFSVKMLDL